MTFHANNRTLLIEALRRELVGPCPSGKEIDLSRAVSFHDFQAVNQPHRQAVTGEEILTRDSPTQRYGVGVLFPLGATVDAPEQVDATGDEEPLLPDHGDRSIPDLGEGAYVGSGNDADDFDISAANAYQPSSMGISFLVALPDGCELSVEVTGGRYDRNPVSVTAKSGASTRRTWWSRRPVSLGANFPADRLIGVGARRLTAGLDGKSDLSILEARNLDGLDLRVEVLSRPWDGRIRLVTVCLVNRTRLTGFSPAEWCLFQTGFSATVIGGSDTACVLPYPSSGDGVTPSEPDEEQAGYDLLYRSAQTFATGHGCAADWDLAGNERARAVRAEPLPVVEVPNITPDVLREDGTPLVVSMANLAGLSNGDDWSALTEVIEGYERWISGRRAFARSRELDERHRIAAERHLDECARAAERMRAGLAYLRSDLRAWRAFQLANHAVLLQQLVTRDTARETTFNGRAHRVEVAGTYLEPNPLTMRSNRGTWRAFQIAFLLATVRSAVDGDADDRELVELIWFPTGGGKTEAYLGLAAFAMFMRRLSDKSDDGVHVLMRYTLRLLTAQQFQRASGLICAMEFLRRRATADLGDRPFSIGIWLGGDTTPNTRSRAIKALEEIEKSKFADNPFLIRRCPWCGAEFRRLETTASGARKARAMTAGYERYQEPHWKAPTVRFMCPDQECPFAEGLPVYVIDEDIYEARPTLVIGTIDKFAMLAWRPAAHSLFGLNREGHRAASPPGLIIQDELHLIAGPLGSIAGLYETAIEDLCTDRRNDHVVRPKIVGSTATIRRYRDQIRSLYARERTALFPPPGLDAGDSFFARYDAERPGRIYVGVHAVSLGSVQTEWVRAFTALLQAPMELDANERDPWWTILVFFNSIREMGTAHTLFQSDIPDYARVLWERLGVDKEHRRYLRVVRELTGGLKSEEITRAIADLEVPVDSQASPPIDVCLASNIIEVGIDIPRLALMVVAGQPKTTSQYIQVTGRVGRLRDRPGLVVTLYSPSKPRDRSHFERFRGYHERLYAQVEPTSVTPFSAPALDRALHAVLVAYARQTGGKAVADSPWPFPEKVIERFRELIIARARLVDEEELENVTNVFDQRVREWRERHRTKWEGDGSGEDVPQLRVAGKYASAESEQLSWSTLMSMRNVDADCEAEISTRYLTTEAQGDA